MPSSQDYKAIQNVASTASIPITNTESYIESSNQSECATPISYTVPPPLKKRKINESANVTAMHVTDLNDNKEISLSNDSRRKNKAAYNQDTNNNVKINTHKEANNVSTSTSEKLKNSNVKKAKKVRFPKIPYPCDKCDKVYVREKCLLNHKLLKHPEEASTHIDSDQDNVSDNGNDPYSTFRHSPASILCPSELDDEDVESLPTRKTTNARSSHSSEKFRNRNTYKIYDIPNDKPKDKFWKNTNVDFDVLRLKPRIASKRKVGIGSNCTRVFVFNIEIPLCNLSHFLRCVWKL